MWPVPHFFLIFAISPKIQVCKTGLGCNRRFEALFHDIKVENKWIIHKNCKFPAQWPGPCRYCANFFGQKAPSHQKIWIKKIVSNARLFPFLQQNSGDIISRKCFRLFGLNIFAPWYLDDWVKWCEQGSISDGINGWYFDPKSMPSSYFSSQMCASALAGGGQAQMSHNWCQIGGYLYDINYPWQRQRRRGRDYALSPPSYSPAPPTLTPPPLQVVQTPPHDPLLPPSHPPVFLSLHPLRKLYDYYDWIILYPGDMLFCLWQPIWRNRWPPRNFYLFLHVFSSNLNDLSQTDLPW